MKAHNEEQHLTRKHTVKADNEQQHADAEHMNSNTAVPDSEQQPATADAGHMNSWWTRTLVLPDTMDVV